MKTPSFVPLDKNKHKNLKVRIDTTFSSCKTAHLAAISLKEVPFAASAMPLVIIQTPENGTYHIAGMMGVEPNVNLYCQDDTWQGHHVPWNIQRYPFDLRGDKERVVIYIDENSELVGEKEGEPLFDADGNATQQLENMRTLISQIADSEINSVDFFRHIKEYNLLDPISIKVTFADGERKNLVGMYSISETRLLQLPDEAILELTRKGTLGMLYAILTSTGQLNTLVRISKTTGKPIANIQYGLDDGTGQGAEGAPATPPETSAEAEKPATKAKKATKKTTKKTD